MGAAWRSLVVVGAVAVLATACGDDSIGDGFGDGGAETDFDPAAAGGEDFDEALAGALATGGGGKLVFDGEEIPIAAVTCSLGDDTFDVGSVSDNGFRVFVTQNNPLNDVSSQILDSDFLQWFPQNVIGDEAERSGVKTFTSGPKPYFNNSDDRIVEASYTVECP
jgi:hypothetical protein